MFIDKFKNLKDRDYIFIQANCFIRSGGEEKIL